MRTWWEKKKKRTIFIFVELAGSLTAWFPSRLDYCNVLYVGLPLKTSGNPGFITIHLAIGLKAQLLAKKQVRHPSPHI